MTIGIWRRHFAAQGLAGLYDKPRSGKQTKYPAAELRQRIIAKLEKSSAAGLAAWDGGALAKALSVSDDAVWRVLRKNGHPAAAAPFVVRQHWPAGSIR